VEGKHFFKHVGKGFWFCGAGFVTLVIMIASMVLLLPLWQTYAASPSPKTASATSTGNWTTYMGNNARAGVSPDTSLNASNASKLKVRWKYKAGGMISTQPLVANTTLYWGAWDGYEYAADLGGHLLWKTSLGNATPKKAPCTPLNGGIASTATLGQLSINGAATAVLFLGGGNASFYALDATSGKVIWSTVLGDTNTMIWDAPAVYNGSIYIGLASYGNCPLTAGKLIQLDATTGHILHSFQTVPSPCVGGGIWGAPTIDEASGVVFISTGTIATCKAGEPMAYALVALNASDLSLISSWQVSAAERSNNSDFGSTPTLFNATINGTNHQMIGLINKNGIYYALDRTNVKAGPLWKKTIAVAIRGPKNSFSSSAWDGTHLYAGDATTTINGQKCQGSLSALDPATGNYVWEYCASGRVVGALTVTSSLLMAGTNTDFVVVDVSSGKELYHFHDGNPASRFWGAPTISNGVIYVGNRDGYLYAFGL
jgi:polyvinyl alcohol dehydrogenase (cytochrome)